MNDSGEFQDTESNYGGKNSHVPSQPAVVPSPRSVLSRRSMPFDTWKLTETQGNVFGNPRSMFSFIKEFFTLRVQVPPVQSQCT